MNKIISWVNFQSDKKIGFLLLFSTFFIRAIYAVYFYVFQPTENYLYYRIAQEIVKQGKIFYDTTNSYQDVIGPVLPWLNAITILIFGSNYLGLYLVTAIGSAFVTFYTYKTARLVFR